MKRIKRLLYLFLLLFIPTITNASNYEVKSYNIDVDINEKREYTYDESIEVYFNEYNTIVSKELIKEIQNIKVNTDYTMESRDTKIIKINSKKNLDNLYNYKYLYVDKETNPDIYEVKIENNFNSNLNNITFNVTFTEDFNKNNLEFYLNGKRIKDIDYEIKNNTVTGTLNNLKENEVLTIKIDYGKLYLNSTTLTGILAPIILAFISFLIWHIYGKDLKYNITRTPNISRNLSPLDVSLIYNGEATEKDAYYLLIHLANKGYIKIIENSNNDFTIKKGKEYDGKNYKEATFIKSLFRKTPSVTIADYLNIIIEKKQNNNKEYDKVIENDELNYRFQRATNNVLPLINNSEEKKRYFENKAEIKKYYLLLIVAIILILVTSLPFIEINKLYYLPLSVVFSIFSLYILTNFVNSIDRKSKYEKILLLTVLLVLMIIILLIPSFRRNRIYIIAFLIGVISVSFILFLYKYMPKRSIYGTKQYSKIASVKEFLTNLSNSELDNVLEINPNYLYDILPYSYLLESEDIVFKKLKEYNTKKPTWYILNGEYTPQKFNNSLNRLYENIKNKNEE